MFALGLMSWLYTRPTEGTIEFLEKKFAKRPEIAEANTRAFQAGYAFGETSEDFAIAVRGQPAQLTPGTYRQHHGQPGARARARRGERAVEAAALPRRVPDHARLATSSTTSRATRTSASAPSRPRTRSPPSALRSARASAARSASAPRAGPGVILKMETIGLAVTLELPLLILDIQRAGPSTGMPTKPEQADLLDGHVRPERRVAGPGDRGLDARRLLRRRDRGGADRAQVPHAGLPALRRVPRERLRAVAAPGRRLAAGHLGRVRDRAERRDGDFLPYLRDPETLARQWAIPGTPGLEHRIGGLEKADVHRQRLVRPRQPRPHGPPARAEGRRDRRRHPRARGRRPRRRALLVLGWGGDLRPDRSRRRGASARTAARSRTRT